MRSAPSDPGVSVPPQAETAELWASTFSITSPARVSSSDETWSPEVLAQWCAFQIPLQLFTGGCGALPAAQAASLSHFSFK